MSFLKFYADGSSGFPEFHCRLLQAGMQLDKGFEKQQFLMEP